MKKILPALAAILAAILLMGRSARTDPGSLAEDFYRHLFRREAAREVFGMEEEELVAVFGETPGEADPV